MKLSKIKEVLNTVDSVKFQLPNGEFVPQHFHVTEVGLITKNFIDCGGKIREEKKVNFQLWEERDYNHRLAPGKLQKIIEKSESLFELNDLDIEIEYQTDTIGKYNLDYKDGSFQLVNTKTACLALEACGVIDAVKEKVSLSNLGEKASNCCTPDGGCC